MVSSLGPDFLTAKSRSLVETGMVCVCVRTCVCVCVHVLDGVVAAGEAHRAGPAGGRFPACASSVGGPAGQSAETSCHGPASTRLRGAHLCACAGAIEGRGLVVALAQQPGKGDQWLCGDTAKAAKEEEEVGEAPPGATAAGQPSRWARMLAASGWGAMAGAGRPHGATRAGQGLWQGGRLWELTDRGAPVRGRR